MTNTLENELIPAFIIAYSNSDFTNPHELVLPDEPADCRADYTHMGVKYTGLETCRHANTFLHAEEQYFEYHHNKYNWVHIGLKERATIEEIKISTKYFTGNQVREVTLFLEDELTNKKEKVLDRVSLQPDEDHIFSINRTVATECYIQLYCEGGITRILFLGKKEEPQLPEKNNLLEMATISHISNKHYGNPKMAVYGNRKEPHMVGWESARTGYGEQALFHFRKSVIIEKIIVDTYLHRLNAPLSCHIFATNINSENDLKKILATKPKWMLTFNDETQITPDNFQQYMLEQKYLLEKVSNPYSFKIKMHLPENCAWKPVLPFAALHPDTYHRFSNFENNGVFNHLLYMHYPNGGIHGLKVFGKEIN